MKINLHTMYNQPKNIRKAVKPPKVSGSAWKIILWFQW